MITQTLYEQDYNLWLETTIKHLRQREFSAVDWENLIEELESMGRSDRRAIISLLTRLLEHLLKLAYWKSEREYNDGHGKAEIRNFRKQLKKELKTSPSLNVFLVEIFDECYQDAREIIADRSKLSLETFSVQPIATVEQALDENWLPINISF